jgi:hypothetical protein
MRRHLLGVLEETAVEQLAAAAAVLAIDRSRSKSKAVQVAKSQTQKAPSFSAARS